MMDRLRVGKVAESQAIRPGTAGSPTKSTDTTVATLDNGLTVVVRPFPQLESVTVLFGVRYGSINLPESDPRAVGAHFLEHMLFRGTARRTADEIIRELNNKDISNALTSTEHTYYYIRCYRGDTESAVELLSDMMRNSTIRKRDMKLETGPIIDEYLEMMGDPEFVVNRAFHANLFPGHNASELPRIHGEEDIKSVKRDMLMEIYRGQYTPDNSTLILYGAISRYAGLKLAQQYFGGMRGEHVNLDLEPANINIKGCNVEVGLPASYGQAAIQMGLPIPCFRAESDEKEHSAIGVLSGIISDRLYGEIRTQRGLAYEVCTGAFSGRSCGWLSVNAKTRAEDAKEVTDVIRNGLGSIAKGEITAVEVRDKVEKSRKEALIEREDTLGSAGDIADYTIASGKPLFVQQYPDIIASLGLGDITAVAAKYLDLSKLVSVVGMPEK